ncbi:MAG: DUF3365 domain-containing protein [Desulfobacteraceae bacterium]|nr:DUF3365 domain-containing protein [Desulfobacteraceae bacterium]
MKKLSTKLKFRMGSAVILILFCAVAAIAVYNYQIKIATNDIYRETEIFIATADATRTYVKDVLRPTITELLPEGAFVPHAMSTSFVGREIMERLKQRFPRFIYKRAAGNPMNPINQADGFETAMLAWFSGHRDQNEWHGIIEKDHRAYYTRLRAIYAENECLACHGRPEDAPPAVKEIYGENSGYYYTVGEVVAADTIYIPVDVTFIRIKEAAWMVFLIAMPSLFFLLGLFHLLFNRTVVLELKGILSKFRTILGPGEKKADIQLIGSGDEIDQLKSAFEIAAMDLQKAHDDLSDSESKYRMLFESSQDPILIIDRNARIMNINQAGMALFGFADITAVCSQGTVYPLFWNKADGESLFDEAKTNHSIRGRELYMRDRNGKKLMVMLSATVRLGENEEFAGMDATLRDITDKQRLENQLAKTEKLASIGQLASGVAHEINNPLGVIRCYTNLIEKSAGPETPIMNDIRIIRKHTDQCKTVVEALLNFARVPEAKKRQMDIHSCLDDVLNVLEIQMDKQHFIVQREFNGDVPLIVMDVYQIQQVFMNLLINAKQAMPEGGRILVRTRFHKDRSMIAVDISDTGQGIPEDHINKIFDPFFTTKQPGQGTGLGLSVSYGIVKQHGGDIEVNSNPAMGTTFTVLLPIEQC